MLVSLSILSFEGNLFEKIEKASNSPHDLLHIDFMDDFDLEAVIHNLRSRNETFDLHIVSKNAVKIVDELRNKNLLKYLNYCFVQVENLGIEELAQVLLIPEISPAIMVSTNVDKYAEIISSSDSILIMASTPGKSGGSFNSETFNFISLIQRLNDNLRVYIDGGVSLTNFDKLKAMSLHTAVIGSFLAKSHEINISYRKLRNIADTQVKLSALSEPLKNLPTCRSDKLIDVIKSMAEKKSNYVVKIDKEGKLSGIITDGDIKRFIVKNKGLNEKDKIQFNTNFICIDVDRRLSDLLGLGVLRSELGCIPLRSKNGKFESAITMKSIWGD